jgi:hypothetical protein
MSLIHPITAPAGAVPELALAFAAADGGAATVSQASPLPIVASPQPATSTALAGTASSSGTVGPFLPQLGRPIWLALSGIWTGSVALLRSADGGATQAPLTVAGQPWGRFTANGQEAVVEESSAEASYYLGIQLQSGSVGYRVSQ